MKHELKTTFEINQDNRTITIAERDLHKYANNLVHQYIIKKDELLTRIIYERMKTDALKRIKEIIEEILSERE